MKRWRYVLLITGLIFGGAVMFPALSAADCDRAKALYEEAVNQSDIGQRIDLLERSARLCRDFNAYYELGLAYEAGQQYEKAKSWLMDARSVASTDEATAKASSRLGLVHLKMEEPLEAYGFFRESVKHHPFPKVEKILKEMDLQRMEKGMSSNEIILSLHSSARSGFLPVPSVDLYINFEYDSDKLNESGRDQARKLANALADASFEESRFTLIGHTDAIGSQTYNLPLSERRAQAVKNYLVKNFSISPDRISIRGRGKLDLLYNGTAETDHALNRRVEVQVEP